MKEKMAMLILRKISVLCGLLLAGFLIISQPTAAHAQTAQPQTLITWQAHGSYVPPNYHDKALPNWASQITASVIVISGGSALNLKNQTIYWYADDTLIGGGQGMQAISFIPSGGAPNLVTLKVELPDYPGGLLIHTIQLPVVQPKAVIEANHPSEQFGTNALTLQGIPYFFDVTDPSSLSYAWSVNGASPAAAINPQTLDLNVNPNTVSGSTFATSLTITDPNAQISGNDSTNLIYVKQL